MPRSESYSYNGFNQLLSVTASDGTLTTFGYDGNGDQVSNDPVERPTMTSAPQARPASVGERCALVALLVLTPTVAHAHGEQLLFLFLYFPLLVVMASLVIGTWTWRASPGAKARTLLLVAATTLAIFALNYYGEGLALFAPLGGAAFLLGLAVQFGVPALVWRIVRRREERRAKEH